MTAPQPALFPSDQPCPVPGCGAIKLGDQNQVPTCRHDLEPPDNRPYRRPKGCLNTPDPTSAPIPY